MGLWQIVQSEASQAPLRPKSVSLCITSPPNWSPPDRYTINGLGTEADLNTYLGTLVHIFRRLRPLLTEDGVLWIVVGGKPRAKQILEIMVLDGWQAGRLIVAATDYITVPYFDFQTIPPNAINAWIKGLTEPGDLVFDPMCGSGTVGLEAVKMGRRFVGADVRMKACRLARGRLVEADKHKLHRFLRS